MKRLNNGAFTLIELLIVISIISVLIALILPSLKSARDVALGLTCMTRMRTMSAHVETYRQDYKMWYIPNATSGSTPHNPLAWSYFDGTFENLVRPYTNTVQAQLSYATVTSTKPGTNPFICPDTKPHESTLPAIVRQQGWINGTGSVYGNYRVNSYFGFGTATDGDNKINRRCRREIFGPASTMALMAEWQGSNIYFGDLNRITLVGIGVIYRHGKTTNLMFGDGHGKPFTDAKASFDNGEFRMQQ